MNKQEKDKSFLNGLSPLEEDFIRALWKIESGEISDVLECMEHSSTPYTTVASIAQKLEKKGYVHRVGKKRGFVYAPRVSEEDYCSNTVGYVVSNFFTGSYKGLIQHFASEGKVSAEDLQEILKMIEDGDSRS
ncbi:BlaI/MecI/CopY family transcriptional regulator [Porphyromonas sp.]|uniref:BlaI/MecI/CopY family transcriptional regulator n=1 Tax=Porphyromonas sp. TaxID=1924944 RepID=UPI0026DB8BCC|nr:BlaI/MecI/CopY family transcriptional regulator [Porphyromonas sp.]MDO4770588.1 BlaI/MecI/CopY family transcriptional regulator [Porphyromonas sp.]